MEKKIKTDRDDCKEGDVFYSRGVVNMWDFPPEGAFVYYDTCDKRTIPIIIRKHTSTGGGGSRFIVLKPEDVTDEIRVALNLKTDKEMKREEIQELVVAAIASPEKLTEVIDKIHNSLSPKTFDQAAAPLIKYMAENHHPHTTTIVTSTSAELLEGQKSFVTHEYLVD